MFQVNDYVVYGTAGVCKITDIRREGFGGGKKTKYYVLQPVFERDSTIYAPVENSKIPIRCIVNEDEIYSIIHELPEANGVWIENDKLRNEKFKEVIRSGDCREIAFMIKALYMHKYVQIEKGRKLHIADDNIMKTAESLIYSEFAHVLKIEPDDVVPFILREAYPDGTEIEDIFGSQEQQSQ